MRFLINLKNAVRNLFRRGQHNVVKILCLTFGLATGSVLIAEVYFEQSYDTFFPGHERTYIINEQILRDGKYKEWPNTSGAIAQAVKRYAPQVEAATRYTGYNVNATFETEDKKEIKANFILADSCFFDVVQTPILQGNAKQILSRPCYCMINRTLAKELGGDVVGKMLKMKNDSVQVIVGGVFEDIPLNSRMEDCKLVTSLSTLGKIWSGFENGSEWWVGNDRYTSLIRLSKSSKIDDIYPQVHKMKMENLPVNDLKKSGTDLNYTFTQLSKAFTNDPSIKKMTWILSLLAFLLLFSAVMNYLLIVIGNMVGRSKEMAIRKCYGAEGRNIHSIIFSEALVHVLISVVFAALLLYACKGTIENLLSAPLSVLLFNKGSWILGAIVVFVLLIGGIVPGFLYSSVPVASAFRGYNNNRHRWKLGLLSIQFITVGFLISLLFVINRQYNMMLNDNPGFQYHDVAVAYVPGITSEQSEKLLTEFSTIPGVEKVSSADNLLTHGQSGNNIYLPNDDREYFNISDLYNVSDNYLSTMGIKILQGRNFTEGADSLKEVMVSQAFVDTMKVLAHWDNNAIGRRIIITEHSHHNSTFTICGVYNNLCMGSLNDPDIRPSVMFYTRKPCSNILIKFHSLTSESMKALSNKGKSLYPDKETGVYSYATLMSDLYQSQKNFRSGVLIEGLVTFFLALLGLIGYTNDEVNRRHKEIALRKVNGAEVNDIIKIFISDIMRIALPSLVVGAIGAYFVATKWLELFSERISLNLLIFVASVLVVLIFILATVIANCYRVANSNPVDYLRADN